MTGIPLPLFALGTPPLTVARSDGAEFASMALLALVLAAASLATRRLPRADGDGRDEHGRQPETAPTRARS